MISSSSTSTTAGCKVPFVFDLMENIHIHFFAWLFSISVPINAHLKGDAHVYSDLVGKNVPRQHARALVLPGVESLHFDFPCPGALVVGDEYVLMKHPPLRYGML